MKLNRLVKKLLFILWILSVCGGNIYLFAYATDHESFTTLQRFGIIFFAFSNIYLATFGEKEIGKKLWTKDSE